MIHDLDDALRLLVTKRGELDASDVDISFDVPSREWAAPVTRPTVNFYLYDVRENLKLREYRAIPEVSTDWTKGISRRIPARIDVSYMVTCWTNAQEDHHRILWRVLETLMRHPEMPRDLMGGELLKTEKAIRLEVAQPDGVLKNLSDFWGALGNQLRPALNLVMTLELDLNQVVTSPLVFARAVRTGQARGPTHEASLAPSQAMPPLQLGGLIQRRDGTPVAHASVRLLAAQADGLPRQIGTTVETDVDGRYRFRTVRPGEYTLVIEQPGKSPVQRAYPVRIDPVTAGLTSDFVQGVILEDSELTPVS